MGTLWSRPVECFVSFETEMVGRYDVCVKNREWRIVVPVFASDFSVLNAGGTTDIFGCSLTKKYSPRDTVHVFRGFLCTLYSLTKACRFVNEWLRNTLIWKGDKTMSSIYRDVTLQQVSEK